MANATAAKVGQHLPRILRAGEAPGYLGMCRGEFDKTVRPHVREFRIGTQGVGFDRIELDEWVDAYTAAMEHAALIEARENGEVTGLATGYADLDAMLDGGPVRGNLMVWGGDIGNEQGNEVYQFNVLTGLWSRGSLPSQITSTNGVAHVVGGVNTAPLSGESWDNLVYLQGVDRLAVDHDRVFGLDDFVRTRLFLRLQGNVAVGERSVEEVLEGRFFRDVFEVEGRVEVAIPR